MIKDWWTHPCGRSILIVNEPESPDEWYLDELIFQVDHNILRAEQGKDEYAQRVFNKDFDQVFPDHTFYWLPQLPKEYKEMLSWDAYSQKEPIPTVLECYNYFQRYAVALNELANEAQGEHSTNYPTDYLFVYRKLEVKQLLCEMHQFMEENNIPIPKDSVFSDSMPKDQKKPFTSQTKKNIRDFIIYKEYINCLEYFGGFLKEIKSIQEQEAALEAAEKAKAGQSDDPKYLENKLRSDLVKNYLTHSRALFDYMNVVN